jgi:hypothetical protein
MLLLGWKKSEVFIFTVLIPLGPKMLARAKPDAIENQPTTAENQLFSSGKLLLFSLVFFLISLQNEEGSNPNATESSVPEMHG